MMHHSVLQNGSELTSVCVCVRVHVSLPQPLHIAGGAEMGTSQ